MKKVLFLNDTSNELHIGSRGISELILKNLEGADVTSVQYSLGEYWVPGDQYDAIIINAEGTLARNTERANVLLDVILNFSGHPNLILLSADICEYASRKLSLVVFEFVHYRRNHLPTEKLSANNEVVLPDLFYYVCQISSNQSYLNENKKRVVLGDSHDEGDFNCLKCIGDSLFVSPTNQSMMVFYENELLTINYMKSKFWFLSRGALAGWRKRFSTVGFDIWLGEIGKSRLVITGRFHHAIAALATGIPVLFVETNTTKMDQLKDFFSGRIERYVGLDTDTKTFLPYVFDYSSVFNHLRDCAK